MSLLLADKKPLVDLNMMWSKQQENWSDPLWLLLFQFLHPEVEKPPFPLGV